MVNYNHITQLITELLYKYDCVIVPDFGGFVAQNYSATFTKGSNLLLPPSKNILFNKNLKHNDGLLISAYTKAFAVNYDESTAIIADYKDYLVSVLTAKKRFELLNLGLLYIDVDTEIRFEPKIDINFLINSFGLEPIIAPEIEQPIEIRVIKPVFEDRRVTEVEKPTKKIITTKRVLITMLIPFTFAFLVFALNLKPLQPAMQSSLNPFYSAPKNYIPLKLKTHRPFYLDKIVKPSLITDINGNAAFKLTESGTILIAKTLDFNSEIRPNEKTILTTININAPYQIVVGCFGVKQNANRLIKQLKSKKINATISGVNNKGLYVVSCGGFNAKEDASQLLLTVKNDFQNAWLMTK